MTTTTEEAPRVVSVGDRVRITELDEGWANGLRVGDEGTLSLDRGAHNTCCGGNHRFSVTRDDGNEGFARAVEPVTERRPGEFRVGDRVRLTSGSHFYALGGVYTGTVVEPPATASLSLRQDYLAVKLDRPSGDGAFGNGIYALRPSQLELVEDSSESPAEPGLAMGDALVADQRLTEATARAERAERELEAFRTKVRDRVIEEAERRGWCSETDDWLVSIGLEPREPQEQDYTVYVTATFSVGSAVTVSATDSDRAAEAVTTSMVIEAVADQLGISERYLRGNDPDWEIDSVELADY